MGTRKIKDAKDLTTGEKIYFKGHAKATFMSDGRTVEDAIASGGGSGGSVDPELNDIVHSLYTSELNNDFNNDFAI